MGAIRSRWDPSGPTRARRRRDRAALFLAALLAAAQSPAPGAQEPFDAFPAYLWRYAHLGRELPEPWLDAVGGTDVPRDTSAEWVVERGARFYLRHAPGRDALHMERDRPELRAAREAWIATRDPALLERRPCLSDPATRTELCERLSASLGAAHRERADFVALGDEVGVTPWGDPLDLCRGPHCERAWRTWLGRHGARYGLEPHTPRPSTDTVLLDRRPATLAAWLAARSFQRDVVADLLDELAAHARAELPGRPLALLGLVGETAFGGVDLERAAATFDVLEPYPVADALERVASARTLGARCERVLATCFLEQHASPDALAKALAAYAAGPVDGLVLWSDAALARRSDLLAPLADGLAALRVGRAGRGADRDPRGVAWLASDDSLALAWLSDARSDRHDWHLRLAGHQEREGRYERARRAWFEQQRQRGERPGAIDVGRVSPELVERFPRLVAAGLRVVADDELAKLDAYVRAGGSVDVSPPFADLRPDGSRRRRSDLPDWAR